MKRDVREHPDGGWGWVVVFGCNIMMQLLLVIRTTGVFFNEWRNYFGASAMMIGAIGSVHMAAFLFMGPFGGFLCNKIGPRKLAFLSGVIGSVSLLMASQSKSLIFLMLSFGVLGGMGLGFGLVCSMDIIGKYFKRRFAVANSISNSGSGIGIIVLPVMARVLIDWYNWNGAMLVLAAILGNICVCAMVFRPVPRNRRRRLARDSAHHGEEQRAPLRTETCQSSHSESQTDSMPKVMTYSECDASDKKPGGNIEAGPNGLPHHQHSMYLECDAGGEATVQSPEGVSDGEVYRRLSVSSACDSEAKEIRAHVHAHKSQTVKGGADAGKPYRRLSTDSECDSMAEAESDHLSGILDAEPSRRISTRSPCNSSVDEQDQNHISDSSNQNLSEEPTPDCQSNLYDAVTDIKDIKLSQRRPTRGSIYLGHFVKGSGLYLFKTNHRFSLLCVMQVALGTAFTAVIIHFVPSAIDSGVSKLDAALLLSVIGIGSLIGRLTSGPVVDLGVLSPFKLYFGVVFSCGASIVLLPTIESYTGFVIFAIVFGFTSGMFKSLHGVLLRMLVGGDRLASAVGILMPFLGVGNVIGPLFAGWLYDIRGHYDFAFYLCGSILSAVAFLVALMPYLERVERRCHPPAEEEHIKDEEPDTRLPLGSIQSLAAL